MLKRVIAFVVVVGSIIAVLITVMVTYSNDNPILSNLLAGMVGVISGLAWSIYNEVIKTPILEIKYEPDKHPDIYTPINSVIVKKIPVERFHIRVIVKNLGQTVAKNCYATIQVIEKINGCKAFSGEPKPLKWVSSIGAIETNKDIAPHGGEQALEVMFSDKTIYSESQGICNINKKKASLQAYASTPIAYKYPWLRNQDGFCRGKFKVKITIYAHNSKPTTREFILHIKDEWNKHEMDFA